MTLCKVPLAGDESLLTQLIVFQIFRASPADGMPGGANSENFMHHYSTGLSLQYITPQPAAEETLPVRAVCKNGFGNEDGGTEHLVETFQARGGVPTTV
jgi:hypothetical protein